MGLLLLRLPSRQELRASLLACLTPRPVPEPVRDPGPCLAPGRLFPRAVNEGVDVEMKCQVTESACDRRGPSIPEFRGTCPHLARLGGG